MNTAIRGLLYHHHERSDATKKSAIPHDARNPKATSAVERPEDATFTGTLPTLPDGLTFGYARAHSEGASARVAIMDAEVAEATEIMARYCAGELAAFHRLYAMLAPRILGYLTGLLGNRASAEDALQVAFLKVHEARSTYVRGANPVPWVYTIAHRVALDELRRRKRSRVLLTKDGDSLVAEPEANMAGIAKETAVDPDAPAAEVANRALAALELLPESQRQALILTKLHGRSVAEAAMITGSTPGAIKQRAHRAYLTLRELLRRAPSESTKKEVA